MLVVKKYGKTAHNVAAAPVPMPQPARPGCPKCRRCPKQETSAKEAATHASIELGNRISGGTFGGETTAMIVVIAQRIACNRGRMFHGI
jgi:hypothetical protein